jgi:hypothetical protein
MRFHPTFLAIVLALGAGRSYAREPAPSPAASSENAEFSVTLDKKEMRNVFVGHYGETLHLSSDWTAEAILRGPIEIVYFRERSDPPPSEWPKEIKRNRSDSTVVFHRPAFKIKPEEFTPENMAPLRLMQLMVIPKNAPGGFASLEKMRAAKNDELKGSGASFELRETGDYPWTPDTFWVLISTPTRIFQLYTQNEKQFFILTAGATPFDEAVDEPGYGSAVSRLSNSLSTFVYNTRGTHSTEEFSASRAAFVLLPLALVSLFAALLALFPGRARLIGGTSFFFCLVPHLFGAPLLFASWRMGLGRAINEGAILLSVGLTMPWVCKSLSRRFGGDRLWRVFLAAAAANILPIVTGYQVFREFRSGGEVLSGYGNFWMMGFSLSVLALLNGAAFGFTHKPGEKSGDSGTAR